MKNGHIEQLGPNGSLETLAFDQTTFDLAPFFTDQKAIILEASDRFLPELFYPDRTNYYDFANADRFASEGHARLSDPLLNIAMALIAIMAVLGGDFSRRGYSIRIAWASAGAVMLRLLAFGTGSAALEDPDLNYLQYLVPILTIMILSIIYFIMPVLKRGVQRRVHSGEGLLAARAA
jgi:lipopolysaccharide export system permease protein